jgi:GAF domain-containing protein
MAIRHVDCVGSMATRWPGAAAVGVAMKTRRPTKTTKVKHRKGATAARRRASSAINLQKQLDQRTRERDEARKYLSAAQRHLAEALERQTATTEVLQVISRSPGELDTVFRLILENATRICEAKFGNLYLCDGDGFRMVASHNDPPAYVEARTRDPRLLPPPDAPLGRLAMTKQAVHIADCKAIPSYIDGHPFTVAGVELGGYRTVLAVPMLKDNELIGAITICRQEVLPFTDKQIALVENFAAQAVIAIENTRLLTDLRRRTDDLSEALDQQTATSEVLGVISSSPGDLQPVFEAMLANATRICQAKFGILWLVEGDGLCLGALHGVPPAFAEVRRREPFVRPGPRSGLGRCHATKQVVHISDVAAEQAYRDREPLRVALVEQAGARTIINVPMLKEDELIGVISIYRQEVRPFTDRQIELIQNFASQAVIAIEGRLDVFEDKIPIPIA